ncbi:MAG: aspartate aminotransferase family protein [Candidatus Marinimicrobia bacterium]|nr:aspartate aminotransferase family protein [Candidatus Neomarinimicrobiota bacterium]
MSIVGKETKKRLIKDYRDYVSPYKTDVFESYGMDFIMGQREGCTITDITGRKKLINCHSNGGVFNLGHRHPRIVSALKNAVETTDIGNHHFISQQRAELARKLALLTPGDLNYSIFGVSGGEAIDLALKLARGITQRNDIICTIGGYHGHTGLALAAGDAQYRDPFGVYIPGFTYVPFNDIEALKNKLGKRTAAVILETVQATAGIIIPSKEYIQEVRRLCDENGTLLIMDEVQTGLGRTGKFWGFEHFDIIPDMLVSGKGLSGGIYPMSVTMIREPYIKFFKEHPFIHVSTYGGSELGCPVSLEVLKITSNPAFLKHVNNMTALFKEGFEDLLKAFPGLLRSYSQLGLMQGLHFRNPDHGPLFTKVAYDVGLWAIYANNDTRSVQILPPLIIEPEEVKSVIKMMHRACRKLPLYNFLVKTDKFIKKISGKS